MVWCFPRLHHIFEMLKLYGCLLNHAHARLMYSNGRLHDTSSVGGPLREGLAIRVSVSAVPSSDQAPTCEVSREARMVPTAQSIWASLYLIHGVRWMCLRLVTLSSRNRSRSLKLMAWLSVTQLSSWSSWMMRFRRTESRCGLHQACRSHADALLLSTAHTNLPRSSTAFVQSKGLKMLTSLSSCSRGFER
jgi:hypothetical protein